MKSTKIFKRKKIIGLIVLTIIFELLVAVNKGYSQKCFHVESVFVDACGTEGYNEFIVLETGNSSMNISDLSIQYATASCKWNGPLMNAATLKTTNAINQTILKCGWLLQPLNNIVPAHSHLIICDSYLFESQTDSTKTSFANLTDTVYIIYNNEADGTGHFANKGTGTRTFTVTNGACSQTGTYDRSKLSGSNGAMIFIDTLGNITYANYGCNITIIDNTASWITPDTICQNTLVNLNSLIKGTKGGTWSGQGVTDSVFNSQSLSGNIPITYTVGKAPCNVSETHNIFVGSGISINSSSPAETILCVGNDAEFFVKTSVNNELTYKWYKSITLINGATNSSYSINNVSLSDSGKYRCIINATCGSITSDYFTLVINQPSSITLNPINITKGMGDNAIFTVSAIGTNLSYQWQQDNIILTNTGVYSGTNKDSLHISDVTGLNGKYYRCIVLDACPPLTSDSALLTVVNCSSPAITQQPVSVNKCPGNEVIFSVISDGTPELSYQWYKNSEKLSFNSAQLIIDNITEADTGKYSCVISNACGMATSHFASLNIISPPTPNNIYLTQARQNGDDTILSISPGGTAPFKYQWLFRNKIISGATNNNFKLTPITCTDSGIYSCIIRNSCDSVTANIVNLYVTNCSRFRHALTGYVKYDNSDSTVMTNTKVYLANSGDTIIGNTTTDIKGYYVFVDLINGKYKLTCSTNKSWGGVNPVDALIVNRTYIGMYNFTDPLKKLAADVNDDIKINPTDALMINRRYIGMLDKFTISDWLFNNPTVNIDGLDITKNIIAICAGDVNASYIPPSRIENYELQTTNYELQIDINKPFDIPIYLNDNTELGALGLKIKNSESSNLKILELNSDLEGLIYNITDDGVNIAWSADDEGYYITPDKPLLIVKAIINISANLISNGLTSKNLISITSGSVLADFDANLISTDKLLMPEIVLSAQSSALSFTCYPNPFNNIANINYTIHEDANVDLSVYNVLGEKVATLIANQLQAAGLHNLQFNGSNLNEGIFYCRLEVHNVNSTFSKTDILMIAR